VSVCASLCVCARVRVYKLGTKKSKKKKEEQKGKRSRGRKEKGKKGAKKEEKEREKGGIFRFSPPPPFSLFPLFFLLFFACPCSFLFFLSSLNPPLIFFLCFLLFSYFFFFLVCVCVCVCVYLCMYVRAYSAIPCVSANDNVKHVKSNIRYVFCIKWDKMK